MVPRRIRADLHLHTCLSPCGGYDVTPSAVVARAAELGLELIAISDHNSAENVAAAREAARRLGSSAPMVLAGLEVTTAEEAHLLALFEDLGAALTLQAMVYDHLQPGENNPAVFGDQIVANADDEVEEFNPRLLIGATDLAVQELVDRVHALGGLAVACHLDRPAYSLVGQLGMVPPDLALDAVEVSWRGDPEQVRAWVAGRGLAVITNSDAHALDQMGQAWTEYRMLGPGLAELALALAGREGRAVLDLGRRGPGEG